MRVSYPIPQMRLQQAFCGDSLVIAPGLPQDCFRAWFPASGFRDFGRAGYEGVMRNVGSSGFSWSSSVSGIYGYYLYFNQGYLNPGNTTNHAFGLQVRCLRE